MIDFTKPVRTKGGLAVRILCTDGPSDKYPVVGFIEGFKDVKKWTLEGFNEYTGFTPHQLENVPEEVVRYIAVDGISVGPALYSDMDSCIRYGWAQAIKCTFTDDILTHVEIVKD